MNEIYENQKKKITDKMLGRVKIKILMVSQNNVAVCQNIESQNQNYEISSHVNIMTYKVKIMR